ncbi:MAG: DUF3556 domain-containing protein [Myxococcota bacterium]
MLRYRRAMLTPRLPSYDLSAWRSWPFHERVRTVCQSWAIDGYGTPILVYLVYVLKIAAWLAGWVFFCTFTEGYTVENIDTWWATRTAFAKFVLWIMLFEGLGFGCGSGPLTGRYFPPLGGFLYFLRPGTTKLPMIEGFPVLGGIRRTVIDVGLYLATIGVLGHALISETPTIEHLGALVVLVPVMGLLDKTLFLVFRSEHYLSVIVCLLAGADWIAGSKLVWMAIWWGAATSKLNHHFPAVMCVMTSNAPITQFTPFMRRMIYRNYPDDLRPSSLAHVFAHFGTAVEYLVPLGLLAFGDGGPITASLLFIITGFHIFIFLNVPMGVPLEWNFVMIYGAFVLFGVHADVSVLSITTPWLVAYLAIAHLVIPIFGSMFPERVSFLLSHRYYAGNWAYNVWLFRGDAQQKLKKLTRTSPLVKDQLKLLYDQDIIEAAVSKVMAFRFMHLLGGALKTLVPQAVDDIEEYEWLDGELVAGVVVGWNFGEGHLGNPQLLRAVQAQCGFEPGELRVISVESQPIHRRDAAWWITDAATGTLASGRMTIAQMAEGQPWPEVPTEASSPLSAAPS